MTLIKKIGPRHQRASKANINRAGNLLKYTGEDVKSKEVGENAQKKSPPTGDRRELGNP